MRLLLCSLAVAWVACSCGSAEDAPGYSSGTAMSPAEAAPARPATVLVELFTSEGCSSCPPADAFLAELVERQPLERVTIVGVGEHVDYWDRLGWRDPFSSPTFSMRQAEYERGVFRTGNVYTPQIVVDGQFQAIGSDRAAVRRAIVQAANAGKAAVQLHAELRGATELHTRIDVDLPPTLSRERTLDVLAGVVEHDLATHVPRGENRGRTLRHSVVARTLATVGRLAPGRTYSQMVSTSVDPSWKTQDLRVLAFVQDRVTRRVVAVGSSGIQGTERLP